MNKRKLQILIKAIIAGVLVCVCSCASDTYAASVRKNISLTQSVNMGMSKSRDYRKTKSKIALKQVKYREAVKTIRLKKKNMSTFRWSPLLNFKFPEKATLAQEFEFTYKPVQIQSEIDVLNHQLTDIKYEVNEEVSNLYTESYTYQEKISYKEELLKRYKENLQKNQARLLTGEAKQSDIDKIQSSISAVENGLTSDKRAFEKDKSDLTDLIGLDITSGYQFSNPYVESTINRDKLDWLISQTLERSQSYYEAKMNTKMMLTSLDTNYRLMSNQYGKQMGYISSYVSQAKSGSQIDTDAFKSSYDNFLTAVDSHWTGKKKILFVRIPREWFKGSIDGVRYVEDDPYALYTNVLEYQEVVSDQSAAKTDITKQVKDGFENLVTAKNTYEYSKTQTEKTSEELTKAELKNKIGELSFEEYDDIRQEYEELQISTMENLELYSQQLYSYDRLTCGAITQLLNSKGNTLSAGNQGISNVDEDKSGIYYSISSIVEDNIFELGINKTDDCKTEITHFELWINGTQIGTRTELGQLIRHLTLDLEQTDNVIIRLYEDDKFIAECKIDPQQYSGKLNIETTVIAENAAAKELGTYTYKLNKKTGMVTFQITPNEDIKAAYFKLTNEAGKYIYSDEPCDINSELKYLSVLTKDLSKIRVILYDKNKKQIATGSIDSINRKIIKQS